MFLTLDIEFITLVRKVFIKKVSYFHLCLALPKMSEILCYRKMNSNTVCPLYIHGTSYSVQGVNLIL